MMDKDTIKDWALLESDADQIAAEIHDIVRKTSAEAGVDPAESFSLFDDWICEMRETGKFPDMKPGVVKMIANFAQLGWYDYVRRQVQLENSEEVAE